MLAKQPTPLPVFAERKRKRKAPLSKKRKNRQPGESIRAVRVPHA